jgi:hypothetical protein
VRRLPVLVKAYEDNSDKDFMKAALAAQLATSRPTPSFQHVLQQSLAQKHGLEQDGSASKDQGTLYFFDKAQSDKAQSDARVAAISLSADETGDAAFARSRHPRAGSLCRIER